MCVACRNGASDEAPRRGGTSGASATSSCANRGQSRHCPGPSQVDPQVVALLQPSGCSACRNPATSHGRGAVLPDRTPMPQLLTLLRTRRARPCCGATRSATNWTAGGSSDQLVGTGEQCRRHLQDRGLGRLRFRTVPDWSGAVQVVRWCAACWNAIDVTAVRRH